MPPSALTAALLAAVRAAAAVASCRGGDDAACAARGEADDRALLQFRHAGNSSVGDLEEASNRVLATVPVHPTFDVHGAQANVTIKVHSVVPVFPPNADPYIAFVVDRDAKLWELVRTTKEVDIGCASDDKPGQLSPLVVHGNESDAHYVWTYVLMCAWPRELESHRCHRVSVVDRRSGATLQSYEACHDADLSKEGPFDMAMCVGPLFEKPAHPEASGSLLLPQWLEYNVRRGVQQFMFYSDTEELDPRLQEAIRPYLQAGLMAQVRMVETNDFKMWHTNKQLFMLNDCLHRFRGRAKWLLTSADTDEYIIFNETDRARAMPFYDALSEEIERDAQGEEVHAVTWGRINFVHPTRPFKHLQLSSMTRNPDLAHLCPKYFVRPDLVNSLFVHWPTSWKNGTRNLAVNRPRLLAFHYRDTVVPENAIEDRTLASQADALDAALQRRFGETWAKFAARLKPPQDAASMAVMGGAAIDRDDDVEVGAAGDALHGSEGADSVESITLSSGARALAELVAGLQEPTFIEENVAHLLEFPA